MACCSSRVGRQGSHHFHSFYHYALARLEHFSLLSCIHSPCQARPFWCFGRYPSEARNRFAVRLSRRLLDLEVRSAPFPSEGSWPGSPLSVALSQARQACPYTPWRKGGQQEGGREGGFVSEAQLLEKETRPKKLRQVKDKESERKKERKKERKRGRKAIKVKGTSREYTEITFCSSFEGSLRELHI